MFETTVDASPFYEAMKAFSKESRKSMDVVLREQAGIMVGHLISFTPPGGKNVNLTKKGGISTDAKKYGEQAIRSDIAKLFPTTGVRDDGKIFGMIENNHKWKTHQGLRTVKDFANSVSDLERIHSFARSGSTGRVRVGRSRENMALTRKGLKAEFTKKKIKQVGMLNAGWMAAAHELNTAKNQTPTWITRHKNKPGGIKFRHSKSGLTITVSNKMPYFPRDMQNRIRRALDRRTYGLTQALEAMIERKAKRAEQRMKRR